MFDLFSLVLSVHFSLGADDPPIFCKKMISELLGSGRRIASPWLVNAWPVMVRSGEE
jgi:hypothetical protein